jgi:hypothetical protein
MSAPPTEVRDSAGIRIVTSAGPASVEPWAVDSEPTVAIGGNVSDSMHALFRVTAAVRLDDGRIAITHSPAPMIRWYDETGEYLHGAGRPGGGHGEFGSGEGAWISTMRALPAESVATWEHPARRMQVFDGEGRFIRAVVLDLPTDMPTGSYPQMIDRFGNGFAAFLIPNEQTRNVGDIWRYDLTFLLYTQDGAYAGEIMRAPGFTNFTRMVRLPDGREFKSNGRPPFSLQPVMSARGNVLVYGSNERYELSYVDTLGRVTMLVRRPRSRRAITSEFLDKYRRDALDRAPDDPAIRRQWEEELSSYPYPDSLPPYRRIRIDRTGALWVNDYDVPGQDSTRWSVFGQDGSWQADVVLPADWQLLELGEDYLLVLTQDELDIERVEQHGLHRR